MKRSLPPLLLATAGAVLLFACLEPEPECASADDAPGCSLRYGTGGGTQIGPGGGIKSPKGDAGAGGEGGAGGVGGDGGVGGTGGAGDDDSYLDDHGVCRTNAPFDDLGCPPTFPEALLLDRCGTGVCQGVCGFQFFVQDFCTPSLRCVYDSGDGRLVGVIVGSDVREYCGETSYDLVYGDACTEALDELGVGCGF